MQQVKKSALRRGEHYMGEKKRPLQLYHGEQCQCLICGEPLDMLLHIHAKKHGYKDKYAMIADGKIKYLHDGRKRKRDGRGAN